MRKAILMMLLAVVSNSAVAGWVVIGDGESVTIYANPSTIRTGGNKVKMWYLSDYKIAKTTANKFGVYVAYMSDKSQAEFDCRGEQYRTLYFSFHSENMGGGNVVYSNDDPYKWMPIPPESLIESIWKFACKKR